MEEDAQKRPQETASETRRGVPSAAFVTNVAEFLGDKDPSVVLKALQSRLQQYKLVEAKLLNQRAELQGKLPEIKRCLDIVTKLKNHQEQQEEAEGSMEGEKKAMEKEGAGKEMVVDFEVAEGIFAQARLRNAGRVCLWLGANVMLEYPFEEALELLNKNLSHATSSLAVLTSDVAFLRDQVNTTEVTIARVHNWDVQRRRQGKSMAAVAAATSAS